MNERIPRELDAIELRVLGCLLEKEQATPEYYPLTLNSLVTACNQRSNRTPVMELSDREVQGALTRLAELDFVRRDEGARATKWKQRVDWSWGLKPGPKAALTVLLLRGAQTAGEVRSRSARLHEFDSSSAAEAALAELAAPPEPLVMLLEREPGQKEPRWQHVLGGESSSPGADAPARQPLAKERELDLERMNLRLKRLEQQVQELEATIRQIRGSSF